MKRRISCRMTRKTIQDALDRRHPGSTGERADLSRILSSEVRRHLEGCPECSDFLDSLVTYAAVLRTQLEAALEEYPGPEVEVVLQGADAPGSRAADGSGGRDAWIRSDFRKLRLAAVSALAALLVCLGGARIYMQSRTHRMIEQQVERTVAGLYQDPLLSGVESALLRTQPSISEYSISEFPSMNAP
jgi:hypothetical protein